MKLENQVAIITGGSGGMGSAIARAYVAEGAAVVINHLPVQKDIADRLVEELQAKGGRAMAFEADVTDEDKVNEMTQTAIDTFGGLHILVNTVGMSIDGTLRNQTKATITKVLDVDLVSYFLTTKAAFVHMIPQKYGRVINISSLGGIIGERGGAPYAAAKAGIHGLTKSAAREVAHKNITVNCIAPGMIRTPMTDLTPPAALAEYVSRIGMGRFGTPEEIAGLCVYLASEEAAYMTGNIIRMDGGFEAGYGY
jgi:3-oxoacyl-[acyl-carrier protein] reductase